MGTSEVKELAENSTETLVILQSAIEAFNKLINTDGGIFTLIVFSLGFLLHKGVFHSLFTLRKRKNKERIQQIESYITGKIIDDDIALTMKDELSAQAFKEINGIYAERKKRSVLITIYNKTSPAISWHVIKQAFSFIDFDTKTIKEFGGVELFGYLYNATVGFSLLLMAFIMGAALIIDQPTNPMTISLYLVMMIVFFFIAALLLRSNFGMQFALQIRKELQGDNLEKVTIFKLLLIKVKNLFKKKTK
jgi:hypothetical protein